MRAAAPGVVSRVKPATRSLIQRFSCGALSPMVVLSLMASRGGRLIARSFLDELNLPSPRTPATLSRHCEGPKGAGQSRAAAWWLWIATSAAPPPMTGAACGHRQGLVRACSTCRRLQAAVGDQCGQALRIVGLL